MENELYYIYNSVAGLKKTFLTLLLVNNYYIYKLCKF